MPTAARNRADDIRLSVTYLMPPASGRAPAQDQQHERGHQHHLEPDVQVEDVAGQERPADAHQQGVDQRVVAERLRAGRRRWRARERRGQPTRPGRQHHDGAEQVGDEGDAERGRPAARLGRPDAVARHTKASSASAAPSSADARRRRPDAALHRRPAPERAVTRRPSSAGSTSGRTSSTFTRSLDLSSSGSSLPKVCTRGGTAPGRRPGRRSR